MKDLTCPICGTKDGLEEKNISFPCNYNDETININLPTYQCKCCDASLFLDFEKENDAAITKAMNQARSNFVSKSLTNIEKDYDFATIERCFALPPRTLSKWKNKSKSPSAPAAALISLLNTFPWLTKIAFCDFDTNKAYALAYIETLKHVIHNPSFATKEESDKYINDLNDILTKEDLPVISVPVK